MKNKPIKFIILTAVVLVSLMLLLVLGNLRKTGATDHLEVAAVNHDFSEFPYSISSNLKIGVHKVVFKAFYSEEKEHWCMVLPAMYKDAELNVDVQKKDGETLTFHRSSKETVMSLLFDQVETKLEFLYAEDSEMLYVALDDGNSIENIHENKELEIPGGCLAIASNGKASYVPVEGFSGHGNDSWEAEKKSYDMKFPLAADLFGMGTNNDFVLLAGYRDNSLMSFCVSNELVWEIGFDYAPEFRLVNLYVGGEYLGVYFLTERMEIDKNRIEITNAFDYTKMANGYQPLENSEFGQWISENGVAKRYFYYLEKNPQDITGGYLLELDSNNHAQESRFVSNRNNRLVLKRAKYASMEQVNYVADFWQEYEDALYSENGYNDSGRHYTEYIELESFAKQWLIYELFEETSMHSSVYYYKESEIYGDGRIHGCYPWDLEHSFLKNDAINKLWNVEVKNEYWSEYYKHEDFKEAVSLVWKRDFLPALELMLDSESVQTKKGMGNISWYHENLNEMEALETSRWPNVNLMKKCQEIREFLEIRRSVLSSIL